MDAEAIKILIEIRDSINVVVFFFILACVAWTINSITKIYNGFKTAMKNTWSDRAADLFSKHQLEKLKFHCDERLEEYPNDADAHWWMGRHYCLQKNVEKAEEHFSKAVEIYPSWEEDVDKYLQKAK